MQNSNWSRRIGALLAGCIGYFTGAHFNYSGWGTFTLFFILGYLGYNWLAVLNLVRNSALVATGTIRDVDDIMDMRVLAREVRAGIMRLVRLFLRYSLNFAIMFVVAFVWWSSKNDTITLPQGTPFFTSVLMMAADNLVWMTKSASNFRLGVGWAVILTAESTLAAVAVEPIIIFFLLSIRRQKERHLKGMPLIVRGFLWPLLYGTVLLIPHFIGALLLVILHGLYSFKRLMHGLATAIGGGLYLAFVPFTVTSVSLALIAIGCGIITLTASELLFLTLRHPVADTWAQSARGLFHISRTKALATTSA